MATPPYFRALLLALADVALLIAQDTTTTLNGLVRDITGAPVPGTNATLTLDQTSHSVLSVQTDKKGEFRFSDLPPSTYTLKLSKFGFRLLAVKSIRVETGEQKTFPPLELSIAQQSIACGGWPSIEGLRLLAQSDVGALSGQAVDERNKPLPNSIVRLLCNGSKLCDETKAGANGDFAFPTLQPSDHYELDISHPGFYTLRVKDYQVQQGYNASYGSIALDRCPRGDCSIPQLRPLPICE